MKCIQLKNTHIFSILEFEDGQFVEILGTHVMGAALPGELVGTDIIFYFSNFSLFSGLLFDADSPYFLEIYKFS